MTINESLYSSDRMDWETPHDLYAILNIEFNFMLDPCCTAETAKCPLYFTPLHDGLSYDWFGTVFMNPPYGREIKHWMKKAYEQAQKGLTVVCLVPARVDTRWWHDWAMKAFEIRLPNKRLTFHNADNKAPFPVAIVVFKPGIFTPVLKAQLI